MAQEVHQFTATIPAGTSIDDPIVIPLEIAYYELETLDIQVPPGPNGLMGFYLALDDQQWLPWEQGQWLVMNDRTEEWNLDEQIINGTWNLVGYNNGVYDHTVTIRFHVDPVDNTATQVAPTVTIITTPLASASQVL